MRKQGGGRIVNTSSIAGRSVFYFGGWYHVSKYSVEALSDAMRGHLSDGDKVKLDNIGTFYLMADASGNGVASEDLVDSSQINRVNVRFAPQKRRVGGGGGSKNSIPVLASGEIRWERAKADDDSDGGDTPTPTPDPTPGPDEG